MSERPPITVEGELSDAAIEALAAMLINAAKAEADEQRKDSA